MSEYSLSMPFVTVASNGGPHDDASYVAGWEMGDLDRRLTPTSLVRTTVAIREVNVPQADLLAMKHGYTMTTETGGEWEGTGWVHAKFERAESEGAA